MATLIYKFLLESVSSINIMAKGKGKGKGKGNGDSDSSCNCCGCICLCIFLPPVLFVIGMVIVFGENTRVDRIEEYALWKFFECSYNERAKIWRDSGLNSFKNVSFYLEDEETPLYPVSTTSGKYYPVRDKCQKSGDPEEGCILTGAYYYKTTTSLPTSTSLPISIYGPSKELISKGSYESSRVVYYSASQLNCKDDTSTCSSKCRSKGGSWNSALRRCSVTNYLNELCYRVIKENGKWQLDIPA